MLAACGGDKKVDANTDSMGMTPPPAMDQPAMTPGTGTTHEIQMVQDGETFKYMPENLTIKSGDVVVFKSVSGGLHNVQFEETGIPAGAMDILNANIPNRQGPLATELVDVGQSVTISFAGAPTGDYKFFCLPHQTMNMHGMITVQ
ncbi:MAG: plastocyanin/azurin family copper-binding protein [Gemmatimonadales bacterium]